MFKNKNKVFGFVKNVGFSATSSIVSISTVQLIVLPYVARKVDSIENGEILTLIALLTMVSEPIGSALNNTRLIVNKEYEEKNLNGDFNLLLLITVPINAIVAIIGSLFFVKKITFVLGLLCFATTLNLILKYYMVYFRLTLNYKAIFIVNLLSSVGYVLGALLFGCGASWVFIYICGWSLSLLFTLYKNPLLHESFRYTPNFKSTLLKVGALLFVESTNTIVKYADRLVIYPLLGGTAVSVYYSATIISKIISLTVSPVSTVLLSYFSKMKNLGNKTFILMITITSVAALIGYLICILISPTLLQYLYPKWATESNQLVHITTATAVIGAISTIIRPAILKFRSEKWQIWIGISNCILYITFALLFINYGGLRGFCYGILLNSIIQLFIRIAIFIVYKPETIQKLK